MKKALISNIIEGIDVENTLHETLNRIYSFGPNDYNDLEILTYIKLYQPTVFAKHETSILMTMGLYFKNLHPQSFRDIVFDIYNKKIQTDYNGLYTPVQANMIENIGRQRYFSFSSPTSTGKSFVFRHIISKYKRDIVIIVPSRALINEYYVILSELFDNIETNVLTFVDLINKKYVKQNIFIITPERTKDLFKLKEQLSIDLILFDEAQLSNDYSVRGLYYDSVIRRCVTHFPNSKLVFAYPFVDNPEVQYVKNKIEYDASEYKKYTQRNVGQIFYSYTGNQFFHFGLDSQRLGNKIAVDYDPLERTLKNGGSALIYCSKKSIYDKTIFSKFFKYTNLCTELEDDDATVLIDRFRVLIGASASNYGDYSSKMVNMLKHGIVVHHGSLPLAARYILEEFTKKGFCRICFATSTLEQGINMPFDMVWIEKFEPSKPLNVKNIIGRAGRSTKFPVFDYGQIVIKDSSRANLRKILKSDIRLSEISQLDVATDGNDDYKEYKDAIKNGEFSEEYNLTNKELSRLERECVVSAVKKILDELFINGNLKLSKSVDLTVNALFYKAFEEIYTAYLNRQLTTAESEILNSVVKIMLWRILGKSFSQIVWYRYSYAARTTERNLIKKQIENISDKNEIYKLQQYDRSLLAHYIPMFQMIPNKNLTALNLTYQTYAFAVDYDRIVVDTYDYLDKLIGFRLGDAFFAAFDKYYLSSLDERAKKMCNYIKYGTNDSQEIMLLRYGFDFEDFEWLKPLVENVDENFLKLRKVSGLFEEQQKKAKKYMG